MIDLYQYIAKIRFTKVIEKEHFSQELQEKATAMEELMQKYETLLAQEKVNQQQAVTKQKT
ncbi:hypothetical protein ABTL68_19400, partial [Acinetobacter baumannii]